MRVVADENIPFVKEAFADFGDVTTVNGRAVTREILEDASVLLVRSVTPVNRTLLEKTPLKFIATATIGLDHIDTEYLRDNNIGFAYAPGSNAESVAEYIIVALMISSRKLQKPLSDIMLGIIGVGNVGSKVYHHAKTLGLRCLLNDPPKKRLTGSDLYRERDDVLRHSDIVTLHVPLNTEGEDATYHMVNSEFIGAMKKDSVLINTSRGKVVDEQHLRRHIHSLGSVILDVWDNEPSISNETLNITDIGTPHIAGYSYDGKICGIVMIYQSACAYFSRRPVWSIPEEITSESAGTIDVRDSKDPLYDTVLNAYPILDDDLRASAFLSKSREEKALLFDNLRKNYYRRLEFSHFSVICGNHQSREAALLSELNFKVEIQ